MIRTIAAALLPLVLPGVLAAQLFPSYQITATPSTPEVSGSYERYVGNDDLGGRGSIWAHCEADAGGEVDAKLRRRTNGGDMVRVRSSFKASVDPYEKKHLCSIYFAGNKFLEHEAAGGSSDFISHWALGGSGGSNEKTYRNVGGFDVRATLQFKANVKYHSGATVSVGTKSGTADARGALSVTMNGWFDSCLLTNLSGGWASAVVVLSMSQSSYARTVSSRSTAEGSLSMDATTYRAYLSVRAGYWLNFFGYTEVLTDKTKHFTKETEDLW